MLKEIMQILIAALFCAGPGFAQDDFASSDAQQRQLAAQQWLGADYVLAAQKSKRWQDKLMAGLLAPVAYTDPAGNVTQRELLGDAMRLAPREPLVYVAALSVCWHDCDRDALVARLQQLDPDNAAVYYMLAQQAYRRGDMDSGYTALHRAADSRVFNDYYREVLSLGVETLNKRLQLRQDLLPEGNRALEAVFSIIAFLPTSLNLRVCLNREVVQTRRVARDCIKVGKLAAQSQTLITALIGLAMQRRSWNTLGGDNAAQHLAEIADSKAELRALGERGGAFYNDMRQSASPNANATLRVLLDRARMGERAALKWELAHPEVFGLAGSGRSGGEQQ